MADRQTWAERVELWRASGETAARWSAERGYAAATLLWWSSRLRQRVVEPRPATPRVTLARVVVRRGVDEGPDGRAPRFSREPIVVEVGAARVAVPQGSDAASVDAVIAALVRHAGGTA